MVIFLAGFAPGQGALPASRRVFDAPLTGRKTGDTSSEASELKGWWQYREYWGARHIAAKGGVSLDRGGRRIREGKI